MAVSLWPGLEPYSGGEADRFFGRREEISELLERVSRRVATVLFAQSGIGKTSLLKAGAFPAMRRRGLQPIYVRLDHGIDSQPLTEQIWDRLKAENLLGEKVRESREDYTLWEWCHDTGEGLLSHRTMNAVPVLVIDQFEEIFTIGASNGARRQYVEAFLEELADLVENRMPLSFQKKIDEDENIDLDRYDIDSDSYRIVIALREDYLSLLDRERTKMPMVMQNRMLLDRLFGEAAMEVVTGPDPEIIPDGVAEMIVRHVAGDSEGHLDTIQVEPALLSLVCRELDLARDGGQITTELLTGHKDEILELFYERCFEGVSHEAREFIEENMVTESGHRQSLVAYDVAETIGQNTLDLLTSRRLLRTEQHGQTPKIELTHDVLVPLVVKSRTASRERAMALEAKRKEVEAAARLQHERTKRHKMAWGLALAVFVAMAAIVFAILSVLYRSDLVAANYELVKKEKQLIENETNLKEKNLQLTSQKEELTRTAKEKEALNSSLEKALAESTAARSRAEAYLAHFMDRASALVGDATGETGGIGPRTRIALLSRAREMYESLADISDAGDEGLSEKIQEQLFRIRIGEASAAMSNLEHRDALRMLEKACKDLAGANTVAGRRLSMQIRELEGDVLWDLGGIYYSRASTSRDRKESGVENLEKKGTENYRKSIEAHAEALELTEEGSLDRVRIRNKLANSKRRLREWDEAEDLLRKSLAELGSFRAETRDSPVDLRKQLEADTLHKIGNVHWDRTTFGIAQGVLPKALEAYRQASALREELLEKSPDDPGAKYDLAVSLANTGDVLVKSGGPEGLAERKGYPLFSKRVALAKSLYDNNPENPYYRRFYADGLRFLAMKNMDSKDLKNYVLHAEMAVFVDRFQNALYLKTYSDALNRNNRREEMKAVDSMIEKLDKMNEIQPTLAE
ncbi:MAG: hypothetical protein ABJQ29_11485 [Luteolibacter sp.]